MTRPPGRGRQHPRPTLNGPRGHQVQHCAANTVAYCSVGATRTLGRVSGILRQPRRDTAEEGNKTPPTSSPASLHGHLTANGIGWGCLFTSTLTRWSPSTNWLAFRFLRQYFPIRIFMTPGINASVNLCTPLPVAVEEPYVATLNTVFVPLTEVLGGQQRASTLWATTDPGLHSQTSPAI